jgi:hypothetical protein
MAYKKWTEEEAERVVKMRRQGMTYPLIASHFADASADSVKNLYNRRTAIQSEKVQQQDFPEVEEIHKDGSLSSNKLITLFESEKNDPDALMRCHGYDPELFDLVNSRKSVWQQRSNVNGWSDLYASKITVKPKTNDLALRTMVRVIDALDNIKTTSPRKKKVLNKSGIMYEMNIADLHIGKLCFMEEAEDEYNLKIAEQRFKKVVADLVQRGPDQCEKVLFIFSNDFFHFDTLLKTTTSGTPQDTNTHLQRLFQLGCELLVWAIETISELGPVEVLYVGANHDKLMSFFACQWLGAYYRNNQLVTVDVEPKSRKYVEYGNSLIQFSHGHNEKKRIGGVMQVDRREAWGRTMFHEVHAAHIHSEKETYEENGVIVRHISSVTGTDRWHFDSGYVGAVKKAQAFVWHKEQGLINIINSVII